MEEQRIFRLDRMTHGKLKSLDKKKTMVCVAMSPLEVHGPHLPIGQDWFEAAAMLERTVDIVAEKKPGWNFVILPPVPVADDCLPHLGSVNFPVDLVKEVAYRLLLPFAKHGFARLAFSSFHGGPRHMTALEWAADKLTTEYDTHACSMFSAVISRMGDGNIFYDGVKELADNPVTLEEISEDWHAGFVETSIALHLWPELVEEGWRDMPPGIKGEKKKNDKHGTYYTGKTEGPVAKIAKVVEAIAAFRESTDYYSENTYTGFPAKSGAEFGRAMFDHVVKEGGEVLCEFIEKGTEMNIHSPLWGMRNVILSKPLNRVMNDWLGVYQEDVGGKKKKN